MTPAEGGADWPVDDVDVARLESIADDAGVTLIRVAFADQHGVLHGKTVTRAAISSVLRSGITVPSSLLLKDLSGRSVFDPFAADPGVGVAGMTGASDVLLAPDPTTFRVLPFAPRTGLLLCDVRFPDRSPVPFCTRSLLRRVLGEVGDAGYSLTVGPELEFHIFRDASAGFAADRVGAPGAPGAAPAVSPTTTGVQLLHVETLDGLDEVVQAMYDGLAGMELPVRTFELEFGHSQFELTLDAVGAAEAADAVVMARSAIRQICARLGFRATFMSRPAGADTASAGWHLHQSLWQVSDGMPAFMASNDASGDLDGDGLDRAVLSPTGLHYVAGLLANADAATAFSTPTVNGYKRFRPFTLAPDRKVWGVDNRGAMVRAIGRPGDPNSRVENRSGEPGANPYLYVASQAVAGLDGIARAADPGPPAAEPYTTNASRLPGTLADALDALDTSDVFRDALGDVVVDWYLGLKRAEWERYLAHVSDWEQREYLPML